MEIKSVPQLFAVDSENIKILAFKRSEKNQNQYVLRLAEVRGEETMAYISISPDLGFTQAFICDGLERVTKE